jgi:ribosomal protein S18 acetylase RimI-like enzyme
MEDWPERRFKTILVVAEEDDARSIRWLEQIGFTKAEEVKTRAGYFSAIYTLPQ